MKHRFFNVTVLYMSMAKKQGKGRVASTVACGCFCGCCSLMTRFDGGDDGVGNAIYLVRCRYCV